MEWPWDVKSQLATKVGDVYILSLARLFVGAPWREWRTKSGAVCCGATTRRRRRQRRRRRRAPAGQWRAPARRPARVPTPSSPVGLCPFGWPHDSVFRFVAVLVVTWAARASRAYARCFERELWTSCETKLRALWGVLLQRQCQVLCPRCLPALTRRPRRRLLGDRHALLVNDSSCVPKIALISTVYRLQLHKLRFRLSNKCSHLQHSKFWIVLPVLIRTSSV